MEGQAIPSDAAIRDRYLDEGSYRGNFSALVVGKPTNPYGAGFYVHRWDGFSGRTGVLQDFDSPNGTYGAGALMHGDNVQHDAADGRANINAMWVYADFWTAYIGFCDGIQYFYYLGYPKTERYEFDAFGAHWWWQKFQNGDIYKNTAAPGEIFLRDLSGQRFGPTCDAPDPPPPTPTPTRTPTPRPTRTPTPTPSPVDLDGDGFLNPAPTIHEGPSNTNPSVDNCPTTANPTQLNADGNYINLAPYGKAFNDLTFVISDALGDACDADDDNDGLSDIAETSSPPCSAASGPTNSLNNDTDGDRRIDSFECTLGYDPGSAASAPPLSVIQPDADNDLLPDAYDSNDADVDTDDDGILDGVEFRYYGSSVLDANSDGDVCRDGKEVASVNNDTIVNSTDTGQVAQHYGPASGPLYIPDYDMNKDGNIGSSDLQFVAQRYGSCA